MITTLYIQGVKLDQSGDSSVEVNSSVLDISDITKNTGDYTKTFTVPASKKNNQTFKHWYNANIDNSFDSRVKVDGEIHLDGIPFKVGKFRLTKVNVKKGKAETYTINFFGNLVSLKDTLGKDELSKLDLSAFNHDYTSANVLAGLTNTTLLNTAGGTIGTKDIIYNLLSKKQYFYNSSTGSDATTPQVRNISFNGDTLNGVTWNELTPSIRIIKIIDAIEAEYTVANGYENPLVFSRDFFGTTEFKELYTWLNPDADRGVGGETAVADWSVNTPTSPSNVDLTTNIGTFTIEAGSSWVFDCEVTNNDLNEYKDITISMYVDGVKTNEVTGSVFSLVLEGATVRIPLILTATIDSNTLVDKDVYFEVSGIDADLRVRWRQRKYTSGGLLSLTQMTTGTNSLGNVFTISNNFPKIKTIDFLKGLFNMFKLVIIPQDDGTLYIDTLTSYYSNGNTYDVTKYIDFEKHTVSRGIILNEINLKYSDAQTIVAMQFEKNNSRGYGDSEVILREDPLDDTSKILDGETLEFTLPFEKIVYERLPDLNTGLKTNIQYGAIIDESLEPVNPKPLIFYNFTIGDATNRIGFINSAGTQSQVTAAINTPFDSYAFNNPNYALLFEAEFSTYSGSKLNNNLYTNHYKSYVEDIFNIKKRNFVFKAVLPLHIITKIELNDTLFIKGNYYKIDKYSYNLLTNETTLNLINNFDTSINQPKALQTSIYTDYTAKTETVQVTNLSGASVSLLDLGDGTGWVTLSESGNNLSITITEFSTTVGALRSVGVDLGLGKSTPDIYLYQTDNV